MGDPRTEVARREARQLSYRFGVTAPEHIRLEAFAARLGVEILDTPNPISGPSFESREELTFNFDTPVELAEIEPKA